MNSEELILVTGSTGFLGVRLVRELLDRQPAGQAGASDPRQTRPIGSATRRFVCASRPSGRAFRSTPVM